MPVFYLTRALIMSSLCSISIESEKNPKYLACLKKTSSVANFLAASSRNNIQARDQSKAVMDATIRHDFCKVFSFRKQYNSLCIN